MCDQDHFDKDKQEYEALGLVTRRQFGPEIAEATQCPEQALVCGDVEHGVALPLVDIQRAPAGCRLRKCLGGRIVVRRTHRDGTLAGGQFKCGKRERARGQ